MTIPDIDMSQVELGPQAAGRLQYGTLNRLAGIFGRDPAPHRHDRGFQIHLIETGSLDLRLDGVAYRAEAPVLFFTPPSVPHAFHIDDELQGHVVTIDRSLVLEALDRDETIGQGEAMQPRFLPLGENGAWRRGREVQRLFRALRGEIQAPGPCMIAVTEALATLIVVAVLRLESGTGPSADNSQHRHDQLLFRRFGDLVEAHFAEQRPLAWYADELALTESRLSKLCRRAGGVSPKGMLLDRSMREARRLLAFTSHSVIEISALLGYEDASYFSRLFRLRHGTTPLQFRREVGNEPS
ncbi:helix-turn-helix domain-containing protein [Nitrospirillum sp. BR 11163]|uniref:helix-turn-helix domain-containing protein n=1 Tax=Nitrospirillum sp. BR 11163 TaxID=3104323 RepID=UPI002AFEDE19|nr:helix-turn-helix domain-containing protein [Nitrospirillum sp. BR 11163]MEA1672797.1 helix-turn-helix domain-containing protein [Nitrospirillum sp. BR 11163]